jgi:hypothetical protein
MIGKIVGDRGSTDATIETIIERFELILGASISGFSWWSSRRHSIAG